MEVVKISPRGYCYGVVDAMVLALQTARNLDLPRPIYILGMIVHNSHVTDAFKEEGIITLDGENRSGDIGAGAGGNRNLHRPWRVSGGSSPIPREGTHDRGRHLSRRDQDA